MADTFNYGHYRLARIRGTRLCLCPNGGVIYVHVENGCLHLGEVEQKTLDLSGVHAPPYTVTYEVAGIVRVTLLNTGEVERQVRLAMERAISVEVV